LIKRSFRSLRRLTISWGAAWEPSSLVSRTPCVETEEKRFILERHDSLEKREYIRFIIGRTDQDSHVEQGIFQAAAQALEWATLRVMKRMS